MRKVLYSLLLVLLVFPSVSWGYGAVRFAVQPFWVVPSVVMATPVVPVAFVYPVVSVPLVPVLPVSTVFPVAPVWVSYPNVVYFIQ